MNFPRIAPLSLLLCLQIACVSNERRNNTEGLATIERAPLNCEGVSAAPVVSNMPSETVYRGVIEFDDQGQLWSRDSTKATIDAVWDAAETEPVAIVVFAHGWHHNATADDDNLVDFDNTLLCIAQVERTFRESGGGSTLRKTVGIYVGWRGRSSKGFLDYATFWTRKAAAERVGERGVAEILYRLSAIRNANEDNRFVVLGHSFGGGVIYSATVHAVSAELEEIAELANMERPRPARTNETRVFADMVVVLNSAFEAQRFEALRSRTEELFSRKDYNVARSPLFVSITSSDDAATRYVFKAGRFFSTTLRDYRPRSGDVRQSAADRTALGHYDPYLTHELRSCIREGAPCAFPGVPYVDLFKQAASEWFGRDEPNWRVSFPTAVLCHTQGPKLSPVFNIKTDETLIEGHNGIWGSPTLLFIRDLVAVNFAARRTGTAAQPPLGIAPTSQLCR